MRITKNREQMNLNREMIRKIIVSCIAGGLLIFLYLLIFSFSEQNGEQSGNLSYFISEKCVALLNSISGKHWTDVMMQGMAEYFEHPIRKLAHFSEYAVLGSLVFTLWAQWFKRERRWYLITVIWVFISACLDEFHQFFVPGRYASFLDVLLDTTGGIFGMLVCIGICKLWENHYRRKRKN